MNLELVDRIARAVLYEGYMLYPYRASAVKNRQRWNFGAVYPAAFSLASGGTDPCVMQTQCLVAGDELASVDVRVKFLHLLAREVYEGGGDGELRRENGGPVFEDRADSQSPILDPRFRLVESLEAGDDLYQTWQEAVEREAVANALSVSELCDRTKRVSFGFAAISETAPIRDDQGRTAGAIVRRQDSIEGAFDVSAERLGDSLFKITVRILNTTIMEVGESRNRERALMSALVSTHTVLGVRSGEFVSLLDHREDLRDSVSTCVNIGTYPVLVGEDGARDLMLSSPIILYDYPQIAPESAGDLFDSTEIDEILTLRIMTLTDEEKREMRSVDDRARRILERTETMPPEQLMKLHGAVRGLRPVTKNAD